LPLPSSVSQHQQLYIPPYGQGTGGDQPPADARRDNRGRLDADFFGR
jgi:hypothetical protein